MILYQHKRLDNNSVFYIGIGGKYRPFNSKNRNTYWHNIVNKHGYSTEILFSNLSTEEAKSWEIYLIGLYGRNDKKEGRLVNMSDGGESGFGAVRSEEFKKNISRIHRGKILSEETRQKLRADRIGEKHWFYGIKRPEHAAKMSKAVIDKATGFIYESAKQAASIIGMEHRTLTGYLSGSRKNKTTLEYLNTN